MIFGFNNIYMYLSLLNSRLKIKYLISQTKLKLFTHLPVYTYILYIVYYMYIVCIHNKILKFNKY